MPQNNLVPQCNNGSDFWVVSSRRCPQKCGPGSASARLDYFHYRHHQGLLQQQKTQQCGVRSLQNWLKPGVPICLIAHGSFVGFKALLSETKEMNRWIQSGRFQQPVQIIYYTWPSNGPFFGAMPVDIAMLGRRAAFNGVYLAQLIASLPKNSPVSLLGHSHGARTISAALHLLGGGTVQRCRFLQLKQRPTKIRTIFLAAAIDHHWLNPKERYGKALCVTEALLNVKNRSDLPLLFYPLRRPFSRRAIARSGFTASDRRKLFGWNAKVAEIDVTSLVGRRHFWQFYFRRPEIARMIAPYIFFHE